jgi:MFS family permease
MVQTQQRPGFRAVLAVREFRAMWSAELLSLFGDQLARVSLSILVFRLTDSPALTGLAYALTYLPTLAGASLLSSLGDRYPRRTVMVVCDLLSAALVGGMAIPRIPLAGLCALVAVLTALGGPFRGAQQALLPDVLSGERYTTGLSLRSMTAQGAQLLGFAGGGAVVAVIGPHAAFAADGATFLLSGVLVWFGVAHRRSAAASSGECRSGESPPARRVLFDSCAWKALWRDRAVRVLVGLKLLAAFYILPEGLASPLAAELGRGSVAVGLVMAADPLGSVVGAFCFARWLPSSTKPKVVGPFAVCSGLALVVPLVHAGLGVALAGFALSGAFSAAYQVQSTVSLTSAIPNASRAGALGLANSGMIAVQGIGVALGGMLALAAGALYAVAMAGLTGALLAGAATLTWNRVTLVRKELREVS